MASIDRESCPVCLDVRRGRIFTARERMFGLPGEFPYAECDGCGSLYLLHVPDLEQYYPKTYYAFNDGRIGRVRAFTATVRRAARYRAWTRLFDRLNPAPAPEASILDVGAGSGELITALAENGYRDLTGLDRFIDRAIETPRVRVLKQTIEATPGAWDLIMFDHSLEHVVDPMTSITAAVARLRTAESRLLVRLPLVNEAWRRYGVDWVQLDAPRHTFVPTETGMRRLIERAGASVERIVYDSGPFQFWGSELYRAGRTLDDVLRSPVATIAQTVAGRLRYAWRAHAFNRQRKGDQAAFIVRKRAV